MTVHLIKLCVGCDSVEDLAASIDRRQRAARKAGRPFEHVHVTRMTPKRRADLLEGGSLYWVIRGVVQARQRLLEIRPMVDAEGIPRCGLVLDPAIVRTQSQPRRPFQGWRYLTKDDAPADLTDQDAAAPPALLNQLSQLGLR